MSRYFTARVIANIALDTAHNLLTLGLPDGAVEPHPGQFYMIAVNRGNDPLLKRAFSMFQRTSEGLQLMYRIKGKGTALLKKMKREDTLEVIGPLGMPYPSPSGEQVPLVIAGGIGIASLYPFLAAHQGTAFVFYGARSGDDIFMLDALKEMGREVFIATDDGSLGTKGTIVDLLDTFLSRDSMASSNYVLYACGPHAMLKAVSRVAASRCLRAYVSMEEHMACGIGACLGCVVKTTTGYKRVCKEGPVFPAGEIIW